MTPTRNNRLTLGRVVVYLLLILFAVYYIVPLYVTLSTSFKSLDEIRSGNLLALPHVWQFDSWAKAWSSACTGVTCDGMQPFFWNSIKMVIPAVLISTFLGAFNGYVFAHWRFRGSEILFAALLVGCFIPFQVVILPMARLLGEFGLANTTTGLVFVHVVYGTAFTTLFFRNYYIGVPEELIKAARIDGAGFFLIFRKIVLPISGPIFVVCIIWQFTQIWNDFLFGIVFASGDSQPITVGLNNLVNTSTGVKEYNVNMAAAVIAALPTLLVYLVAGRYFVRGLTAGAVKG
ncbi:MULTISPECIES: carbohydrate ABC transporter permease [Janthinobacterium]|jgi:glucose/mannose transport system permease protein|uniref:Carbohydrate ABC transporter permease n=1 Tax=Janthinobacterium agaricidamnosum TaxID=55508 RepID=A0A3G2E6S6_9BURK|nr:MULTISPECIES: carbohydrate ABC transporter permease [Janthinobacterium]AYM76038.1 carbohydrate ABC transporter permease [Janthinobacterium agaricidamnosum]MCC7682498.1 carbohydrate ABC transporter permease [Janthinobacterium sp. FW305-128]OEZ86281.1 L-arabinose transport system permease protein AraQ [Janthinobacterium sp. HH106]OEZ98312.1 L-arabinose transport system permease protein AraQ [Janthinobacterium sp. HH107]PHV40107.1 carbohydrate ABC transporter permease [Janthinobacterium sp. BJ